MTYSPQGDARLRATEMQMRHAFGQPDVAPGTNQLDAARRAFRAEAMARERAERSLEETQVTIRDLQTKLAHERLWRLPYGRRPPSRLFSRRYTCPFPTAVGSDGSRAKMN
jgi:hypothetical protein